MKKVVRLTESDLIKIVKEVIKETEQSVVNSNKFCVPEIADWKEIDDDVNFKGTWRMLNNNEIELFSEGSFFVGDYKEKIAKPNGFDNWRKSRTNGTFEKGNKLTQKGDYSICFI